MYKRTEKLQKVKKGRQFGGGEGRVGDSQNEKKKKCGVGTRSKKIKAEWGVKKKTEKRRTRRSEVDTNALTKTTLAKSCYQRPIEWRSAEVKNKAKSKGGEGSYKSLKQNGSSVAKLLCKPEPPYPLNTKKPVRGHRRWPSCTGECMFRINDKRRKTNRAQVWECLLRKTHLKKN